MTRRRTRSEDGETLVELLISVSILGIAVVGIVAGMATALTASDANRKQGVVEAQLRNFAEAVTDPSAPYVECATTGSYANPPGFALPAGYSATVTSVRYFDGNGSPGFTGSCPSNPDNGVQVITVRIQSSDERALKSLTFAKRRP
jgi:type II secretory pathway pseudopilin PulG